MRYALKLLVILISVAFAVSFKPQPIKVTGQLWKLTDPLYPYDPSKYERFTTPPLICPLEGNVCFIDIQTSDLIPTGQPYAGQPNVVDDILIPYDLAGDISSALGTTGNDPYPGTNLRIIYERY